MTRSRVRIVLFLSILAALLAAVAAPASAVVKGDDGQASPAFPGSEEKVAGEIVPGSYIVVFKGSVERTRNVARGQVKQRRGKLSFVYPVLNGYAARNLSKADAEALRRDPRVRYVRPDRKAEALAQTTPTGIDRVLATANEGLEIDGADNFRVDADVAVLDTGIDHEHPDLEVVQRTDCTLVGSTGCKDGSGQDGHGHGTHVAGTVGALDNGEGVVGVAPGARLWAVKVLDDNGTGGGSWSGIIAGIEWVTAHADQIEVANMSLGGSNEPAVNEAIEKSTEAGVVYVVAAGNSSNDAKHITPANSPDVITVSALADYDGEAHGEAEPLIYWPDGHPNRAETCDVVDETEGQEQNVGLDDHLATFSSFGKLVEVAAPGACILSTFPTTGGYFLEVDKTVDGYGMISGTSMASPHVAGAAAILASEENPEDLEDVEAIRDTIAEAGNTDGIEEGGWEDTSDPEDEGVKEPLLDLSDEAVFDPPDRVALTGEADALSPSEVALHGWVDPNGQETEFYFEYVDEAEFAETGYENATATPASEAGSGEVYVAVEETVEGLEGQTPYHYRLVATDEEKATFYGDDRLFGTTPPAVSAEAAEIGANEAELSAEVNPEGFATSYTFEYGLTESYGYSTSAGSVKAGTEAVEAEPKQIEGLAAETTYHFRVAATNLAGTSYGEGTFTTEPADWSSQPVPNPYLEEEEEEDVIGGSRGMNGVSCSSPSDCMAIANTTIYHGPYGEEGSSLHRYPQAKRWDGESWTHYDLPLPEVVDRDLTKASSVSCGDPDYCIVLGYDYYLKEGEKHPFAVHWDGEGWSVELLPELPGGGFGVTQLSCASPGWCMASGNSTVLRLWQGEDWSTVPAAEGGSLRALSCPQVNACVATLGGGESVNAAAWDGESWDTQEIPLPAEPWISLPSGFDRLSCAALDTCTAVALAEVEGELPYKPYAAHWDGEEWTVEAMPEPPGEVPSSNRIRVSCSSPDYCVSPMLIDSPDIPGYRWVVVERWDGEQWSVQSAANPAPTWPGSGSQEVSCARGPQARCTLVPVGAHYAEPLIAQRLRSSPVATTEPATEVGAEGATLNATVNPEGFDTTYQFEYVDEAEFAENAYENATAVPASAKEIGSGTSNVEVSESIAGLEPGVDYHFRVVASNSAGTTYGEDETFTTQAAPVLALEPPAGFPASFDLAGEAKVTLRGQTTIKCTSVGEVPALEGEGQFEDASAGTATLTLHNCRDVFNTACTTPGESEGTIVAEDLPLELSYLSDGEPGVVFLPNAESGQLAKAKCLGGFITVDVAGSGVLGQITDPGLGEASETLTIDLDAPEVGEGEYAQEYTETEAGLQYGLQMTVNAGEAKPAPLEAEAVASFDEGEGELVEE